MLGINNVIFHVPQDLLVSGLSSNHHHTPLLREGYHPVMEKDKGREEGGRKRSEVRIFSNTQMSCDSSIH